MDGSHILLPSWSTVSGTGILLCRDLSSLLLEVATAAKFLMIHSLSNNNNNNSNKLEFYLLNTLMHIYKRLGHGGISLEDAKAETPVLWPPHAKSWLIGKDWCWEGLVQEEKGTTEDEMAGWHHWLDGHESECTPGVGDGQGGLACCDSWGHKESDTTELNWTELIVRSIKSKRNRSYILFKIFKKH